MAWIGIRLTSQAGILNVLHRLAFWFLLPIAAMQGLALRKKALRLPPPPGEPGGLAGKAAHNQFSKPIRLLALGDSIIAGVGASSQQLTLPACLAKALAQQSLQAVSWTAAGNNGANSFDLLAQLEELQDGPAPHLVLISIGVNDVTALHSSRAWQNNLDKLCRQLGSRWPEALVVFAGLPPMGKFPLPPQPLRYCLGLRAAYFDRIAAKLVDNHAGMLHIATEIDPAEHDFCPDGFHPSEQAYMGWGEEMATIIITHLSRTQRSTAP